MLIQKSSSIDRLHHGASRLLFAPSPRIVCLNIIFLQTDFSISRCQQRNLHSRTGSDSLKYGAVINRSPPTMIVERALYHSTI